MNFIACLLLFLGSRPKSRALIALAALTVVMAASLGVRAPPWQIVLQVLSYAGMAGLLVALLLPFLGQPPEWKLVLKLLFPPAFGILTSGLLAATVAAVTYDYLLYAFDGSLGFQPGFWAARVILQTPGMSMFARFLYEALPLFLAGAYILEERRQARAARDFLILIVAAGLCGAACFLIFPAAGSPVVFPKQFPFRLPDLASIPIAPAVVASTAPRNCMPSLHTSWALVFLWTARNFRSALRWILTPLVLLMLLQTLAYHYLVDMIVAVPFTLSVYALTRTELAWPVRLRAFTLGMGLVAIWLAALRWMTGFFLASPVVSWSAALVTIGFSLYLRTSLDRAEDRRFQQQI